MCWKYEWSHAIKKMQQAIEHISYARGKLIRRRERNEKSYKNVPSDRTKARIGKNNKGIMECELAMANLKETQDLLFQMVHEYGISHTNPKHTPNKIKRMYKYMGNYYRPGMEVSK